MKHFTAALLLLVAIVGTASATYLNSGIKGGTKSPPPSGGKGSLSPPSAKGGSLLRNSILLRTPAVHQPTKPLRPIEQKIEQTVQQQVEEDLVEQKPIQQEPIQQEPIEQKPIQQEPEKPAKGGSSGGGAKPKPPKKTGILKWEQRIETVHTAVHGTGNSNSYKPRVSTSTSAIYRPEVVKVQQQLEQDLLQTAAQTEQRPLVVAVQKPELQKKRTIYNNVRQVPSSYNVDAGWE